LRNHNNELLCTLTYNNEDFIAAEYCVPNPHFIVSISDNNTYEIWDLDEKQLIFKSTYLSVSHPTCLCMHPYEQFFTIGFDDGMLRIFDISLHTSVHQIALSSLTERDISKREDVDSSVLSIKYLTQSTFNDHDEDNSIRSLLNENLLMAIGCSTSVYLLNANSLEVLLVQPFTDIVCDPSISSATQICFISYTNSTLLYAAQHMLTKSVHVIKASNIEQVNTKLSISVLSSEPLISNSPLRSSLVPKKVEVVKSSKKLSNKQKMDKMNQPITFNNKVKSSGYTKDKPRKQMFTPKTNSVKMTPKETNRVGPWGLKQEPRAAVEEYPVNSDPPTQLKQEKQVSVTNTAINQLKFTDSGKSLIVALSEETALLLNPKSLDTTIAFTGHNGQVNTAIMGHTNQTIITSGVDRSVKLWMPGFTDPILNLTHYKQNFKTEKVNDMSEKVNPTFSKDINTSMFYYNDQFILLSHGNSLCLYKYYIDENKNDLKRYKSNNRYKLVKDLQIKEIQNITTFSAINSFYSYIVLCACSNRDLVIFDMNTCQEIHKIKDVHTRPIHSLCQNQGSSFVSQPSEAYDLFLTSAPTDAVKLWDLRVARCVRRYEGHANRVHKVGLAYSPCSKYIAVGSEDRSTYIYDIRSSSYLHRLTGQTEVVTSLAFHPQKPLLATGSLSGMIKTYGI